MKTNRLHLILLSLLIVGSISCERADDSGSNLKGNDPSLGLYDFYLYDVNGQETTRITSSSDKIESSYSISPDSKKILYVDKNGINEMNIDGSENRILVAKGTSPCYSPLGDKVAFIDKRRLFVINRDGTNETQIYNEDLGLWHPVWSRDGKYIACSSDKGLCFISLDGDLLKITSKNSADWYDWASDSKEIYYSKSLSNNFAQIFKYNIPQGEEYQLTDIDKYSYSPKCHPIENVILFTSSLADYGGDLIMCDQDGLNSHLIVNKDMIASPNWSPDGNKIVFVTEESNLAIIGKSGENYQIINELPGACMEPMWSNDGKYILYYRAIFFL